VSSAVPDVESGEGQPAKEKLAERDSIEKPRFASSHFRRTRLRVPFVGFSGGRSEPWLHRPIDIGRMQGAGPRAAHWEMLAKLDMLPILMLLSNVDRTAQESYSMPGCACWSDCLHSCTKRLSTAVLTLLLFCLAGRDLVSADDQQKKFDQQIAPLLASRCLECHRGADARGGLDLSTRASVLAGGDSGPAMVPGNVDDSLLLQRIISGEMPPKKPLADAEKTLLTTWIREGSVWGTDPIDPFTYTTESRAGLDWWSLQAPRSIQPPATSTWATGGVDAWIESGLAQKGLTPSPEADRRTLIRRLSYDLLGLPPEPAEVQAFLDDQSPDAWPRLVDRMLDSPHYGERWARHWLDVVRFGESNGFEYDEPRDNFWPYRNWVIDAFNQDLPWDEFVRLQIAGDVLQPGDASAAAAAGFLVAGAHNTTLPSSEKMRMAMAQDEIEDLVGAVGQTFLGLTINCARCHDHKFDPISQTEYYSIAAALSGVRHGIRNLPVPLSPTQQQTLVNSRARLQEAEATKVSLLQPIREQLLRTRGSSGTPKVTAASIPQPIASWEFEGNLEDSSGKLHGTAHGAARLENGALVLNGSDAWVSTAPLETPLHEKTLEAWVQLETLEQGGGAAISVQTTDGVVFDAIVFAEREPRRWMAGSNNFLRTSAFNGTDEAAAEKQFVHVAIVYSKDGTITAYRGGERYGTGYRPGDLQSYATSAAQVLFGLRHGAPGGNRLLNGRIERARLYDRALTPDEVAASAFAGGSSVVPFAQMLAAMTENQKTQLKQLEDQITAEQQIQRLLEESQTSSLYTCVSSDPGVTSVLRRGDVSQPGAVVRPSGLRALTGVSSDFGLPENAADAERRRKLAEWITHPDNPLFARVAVNRIWQYHFGQGLVATPGDLGFSGGQPSHPELLDWLAIRFRESGYRVKALHRLILNTAAWRQSSAWRADAAAVDGENRLLWRKSPQRLEAESLRDTLLAVTGRLDRTIGGRGYRDLRHFKFKGSNFYESLVESAEADAGAGVWRRTIYRFAPRGGRNSFLDTFDCPDPSTAAQRRASTTTPLQALALLNNDLTFEMSETLAERVVREGAVSPEDGIRAVQRLTLGRDATPDELQDGAPFVRQHGLAAWCRVLLNSNEFLYVR
jgi:hypothetical protein